MHASKVPLPRAGKVSTRRGESILKHARRTRAAQAKSFRRQTAPGRNSAIVIAARPYSDNDSQLFEKIQDFLRKFGLWLLPANLEILLPVLGPRPPVIVYVIRVGAGKLRRPAIDVLDITQTFGVGVSAVGIVGSCPPDEPLACANRSSEGFRIVKYRFMIEANEFPFGVVCGLVSFHPQLVAYFEHGVCHRLRKKSS